MAVIQTGLEHLLESPPAWLKGRKLGLLCNPASVNSRLQHSRELINECFPGQLRALYSPQHGFFAEKQDNMIESTDLVDPVLDLPVYSLYGRTRIPSAEMLEAIDVLLVDIQDVGARVYTFMSTVSYCLEQAAALGKRVVVLDRPNPIGGLLSEGNLLKPRWSSFVGRFPIPMRHAMTVGELSLLFNGEFSLGCDLQVVAMRGWRRRMYFEDTGLPWVAPSPNLPAPVSALVYPGQVIWEGTNVSEGRGTTQPFELFGAPYFDPAAIVEQLGPEGLPGAALRPVLFEPVANKWQGTPCRGFQLHVTDRDEFRPYHIALRLLQAVIGRHQRRFDWKPPPYEYEHTKRPIDLIIGDAGIRRQLQAGRPISDLESAWLPGLARYDELRQKYLLYTDR